MRILITGASGFVGQNLVNYLTRLEIANVHIFGLVNSKTLQNQDNICYLKCDLIKKDEIFPILKNIQPERIIHLAGTRDTNFQTLMNTNVIGTKNLMDTLLKLNIECPIVVMGSSAEYGYAGNDPISENTPIRPVTNYGISKACEVMVSMSYFYRFMLPVVILRPFNIIGPGQPSDFVVGKIVKQIEEIKIGKRESIELYSLDSRRDFIDVRDVVKIIWEIVDHPFFSRDCAGNIFNVGSGSNYSIQEILEIFKDITIKNFSVKEMKNQDDIPSQIADIRKIQNFFHYSPDYPIRKSLENMLGLDFVL